MVFALHTLFHRLLDIKVFHLDVKSLLSIFGLYLHANLFFYAAAQSRGHVADKVLLPFSSTSLLTEIEMSKSSQLFQARSIAHRYN